MSFVRRTEYDDAAVEAPVSKRYVDSVVVLFNGGTHTLVST